MKLRHMLLLAFAGIHLTLVGLGAAGITVPASRNPLVDTASLYATASGADSGYGFFAPGVAAQVRTKYFMVDRDGVVWSGDLNIGDNSEANLRFTNASSMLMTVQGDYHKQNMYKSLAAMIARKNPSAEYVEVELQIYAFDRSARETDFPTMEEYRNGKRARWLPIQESIVFHRSELEGDRRQRQAAELASK
ncbi:MAG: hypothetical protein ACE5KM_09605 [Planctomycetaceae bacterium]